MKRFYGLSFFVLVILSLCFWSACTNNPNTPCAEPSTWEMVFRNDRNGNVIEGDKEDLIMAVRNGLPIRVGFGGRRSSDTTRSVEHLTDAGFLTIANGSEVFAQIEPIIGQHPDLTSDTLSIKFRPQNHWVAILGTNGFFTAMTTDRLQDTIMGNNIRTAGVSWFVFQPNPADNQEVRNVPLWRK